jgi:5-carboxyvanillate decarboxylase
MTATVPAKAPYKRIAAEEAWAPPELLDLYKGILEDKRTDDPGFLSMWNFFLNSPSSWARAVIQNLALGEARLEHMDEAGVDMQLLMLTSPGVQILDEATATSFAIFANDYLAEAVARHPDRWAGLAAVAPQNPAAAAKELERAVSRLGLKGAVVNSHTFDHYLDEARFWPIFEAAEALDVPIYIHPNTPPRQMIAPFLERGLEGAVFGFGVETALHVLGVITAGVFDRFPGLKVVVGHMGEGLPFQLYRLDHHRRAAINSHRVQPGPLKRSFTEYFRENIYITNSGVAWEPAIKFSQQVLGADRVMYAMDYPYQHLVSEVVALDAMSMSAEDKAAFFQTNVERVFKL